MNKKELLSKINEVKNIADLFLVQENDEIRYASLDSNCRQDLAQEFLNSLRNKLGDYLSNDSDVPDYTKHDVEQAPLYRFDLEKSKRFENYTALLGGNCEDVAKVEESDIANTKGYLVRIGSGNSCIGIFRKHTAVNTFKPARFMLMFNPDRQFQRIKQTQIQVDSSADMLWIEGLMYVLNLKTVESFDEVKKATKEKACEYVKSIEKCEFVKSSSRLLELVDKDLSFARKIIRLSKSGSKVLGLRKEVVFKFVSTHHKYGGRFKFDGQGQQRTLVLSTDDSCRNFISLLNDDFLKSELTGEDYEAVHKK